MSFSELRTDYVEDNLRYIDGYLSEDDNEEGFVVATVCMKTGTINFHREEYQYSSQVIEAITECLEMVGQE
jgi:hypothetical protein